MINPVYNMQREEFVELVPYMDWVPHINTSKVTVAQWELALMLSLTDAEYTMVVKSRNKHN